jgi:hypothetical protein
VINVLVFIKTVVWKSLFGKEADKLEQATDSETICKSFEATKGPEAETNDTPSIHLLYLFEELPLYIFDIGLFRITIDL